MITGFAKNNSSVFSTWYFHNTTCPLVWMRSIEHCPNNTDLYTPVFTIVSRQQTYVVKVPQPTNRVPRQSLNEVNSWSKSPGCTLQGTHSFWPQYYCLQEIESEGFLCPQIYVVANIYVEAGLRYHNDKVRRVFVHEFTKNIGHFNCTNCCFFYFFSNKILNWRTTSAIGQWSTMKINTMKVF